MRKKALALLLAISMTAAMTAGCGSSAAFGAVVQAPSSAVAGSSRRVIMLRIVFNVLFLVQ